MRTVQWMVIALSACLALQAVAEEGVLDFGPEEFVKVNGNDLVVSGYSVPSFEDWNNDRLKDLVVGEGGGTVQGKVRVYLNAGTESDPCFVNYFYAQSNGADLTCSPQTCLGCFPRLVNWDGERGPDLLIGLADGTVRIYLNTSDANDPVFDGGRNVMVGDLQAIVLDVGLRATPNWVDWNNDGMSDLVIGGMDGLIHVFTNGGGPLPPHFFTSPSAGVFVQDSGSNLTVPSGRSSPVVLDLDGDGRKDLLAGNTDGQILFYRNAGLDALPLFSGYTPVRSNGQPIDLTGSLRSRPCICHWTGDGHFGPKDGYWDLLVGYGDGKVRLYRGLITQRGDFNGDGSLDANDFTLLCEALDQRVPQQGSPADLNADGIVDNLDLRLFAEIWLAKHRGQEAI